MMISLFNMTAMHSPRTGAKRFNPSSANRYMVGRDVNPLTQTSVVGAARRDAIRADGEDVRFTSEILFADARNKAGKGAGVNHFRGVDMSNPDAINSSKGNVLYRTDTHKIEFGGNQILISTKDKDDSWKNATSETYKITEDTRIVWDAGGNPLVLQGSAALSAGGMLKAESNNEILIRMSDRDVEAGAGTIVMNVSGKKGTFTGGDSVTYYGSYGADCEITGGRGKNTYAGYFNGAEINAGDGSGMYSGVFENITLEGGNLGDHFSGYFSGVDILGGNGNNSYAGMFIAGSNVQGGAHKDNFNGRYVDSSLNGGEGDDTFGQGVNLNGSSVLSRGGQLESSAIGPYSAYNAVSADFVDSDVVSGEGNNSVNALVWGGKMELGSGNDEVRGAFIHADIETGDGDDTISSLYSKSSFFDTGNGNNNVTLATARNNSITTGNGHTNVSMGVNPTDTLTQDGKVLGGDTGLSKTTFSSKEEYKTNPDGTVHIGVRFGELEANQLNAETGTADVTVNNGTGTQKVTIGTNDRKKVENEAAKAEEEKKAETVVGRAKGENAETGGTPGIDLGAGHVLPTESTVESQSLDGERVAHLSGEGPEKDGGSALKIKTGAGSDIDLRHNARTNIETGIEKNGIHTFARRFNGYSYTMLKIK